MRSERKAANLESGKPNRNRTSRSVNPLPHRKALVSCRLSHHGKDVAVLWSHDIIPESEVDGNDASIVGMEVAEGN
jgi:hypothetical protein